MSYVIDYIGIALVLFGFFLALHVVLVAKIGERDPWVPIITAALMAVVWPLGLLMCLVGAIRHLTARIRRGRLRS